MPDRAEPLRLLAEGLRRAGGLDRDVPERIEELTGDSEDVRCIAAARRQPMCACSAQLDATNRAPPGISISSLTSGGPNLV